MAPQFHRIISLTFYKNIDLVRAAVYEGDIAEHSLGLGG
jgi:hypothetical protein